MRYSFSETPTLSSRANCAYSQPVGSLRDWTLHHTNAGWNINTVKPDPYSPVPARCSIQQIWAYLKDAPQSIVISDLCAGKHDFSVKVTGGLKKDELTSMVNRIMPFYSSVMVAVSLEMDFGSDFYCVYFGIILYSPSGCRESHHEQWFSWKYRF